VPPKRAQTSLATIGGKFARLSAFRRRIDHIPGRPAPVLRRPWTPIKRVR
jgi:hypothetical protein